MTRPGGERPGSIIGRVSRWCRAIFCLLIIASAASRAGAGELPAAASPLLSARGDSHGWVAVPVPAASGGGAAILHLPPRRATGQGTSGDSGEGAARVAMRLESMPERLAAWENRLFMAFPAESAVDGKPLRSVLVLSVEAGPIPGTWVTDEDGRLDAMPSLPGGGVLAGFVGTARGPLALIRGPAESTGRSRYTLLLAGPTGWRPINLPDGWWGAEGEKPPRLELVAVSAGMEVFAVGGGKPGAWFGLLPAVDVREGAEEYRTDWTFHPLSFQATGGGAAPAPYSPVYQVAQRHVYLGRSRDGRTGEIWEPGADASRLIQRVKGIGEDVGLVALEQSGRVAVVWQEPGEEPGGSVATNKAETRTRLVEISVRDGAIAYEGPAKVGPPISPQELKLLAMALVGLMAVVLIFVLRPEPQGPPASLPKGVALAEPSRRFVAGLIDLAVAAFAASRLTSTPLTELLTPAAFLRDPAGAEAILLLIGFGWAHCTLGEWVLGRSIGKALAGCEVAHVMWKKREDGEVEVVLERPSLWRAAVRNLVRWTIPPLAISGMSAMDHRHRGDAAAGTVVIIRVPERPDDGAASG